MNQKRTFYIESLHNDPHYNLALEQFVFDKLDKQHNYFMLWQNHNSIIVGKNQNTNAEINTAFVNEHKISVVRRLSGGGAVYHDLGNLNFTFITDTGGSGINMEEFLKPVQQALISFGVPAEIGGRNDITVEGKKISGSAQYIKQGRVMHHGALLYDSDLEMLSQALFVTADKIESKGIKSVKSRVTNIRPYMRTDLTVKEFLIAIKKYFFNYFNMKDYKLSASEEGEVLNLKEQVYSKWSWNYGASPPYNVRKIRRIEGCGSIEVLLEAGKEGVIQNIAFYGDFFGSNDTGGLCAILKGCRLEYNELKTALKNTDISQYFHSLDVETFLKAVLE